MSYPDECAAIDPGTTCQQVPVTDIVSERLLRAKLELALDASGGGVSIWEFGSETGEWDHRLKRLYGFPEDQDIKLNDILERIHPEDRDKLLLDVAHVDEPGADDCWSHEFRITHPQLGERWIARRGRVERDATGKAVRAMGVSFDITERKQAEQALLEWNTTLEQRVAERTALLHQSEARQKQMAEAAFEGIAITAGEILIDANTQLAAMHGYELYEMLERPITDFIDPEFREDVLKYLREGTAPFLESLGLRKDGTRFPIELRSEHWGVGSQKSHVTAIRDVSELKKSAARIQKLQSELQQAQRLGLVSEVSAGIVHQIAQPLCAMGANLMAAVECLSSQAPDKASALPMLEDIGRDIRRIRDTTLHFRALANPGKPTFTKFAPHAMIRDVLGLVERDATNRQIRIETELASGIKDIEGDPVQLSHVLLMMIQNAFDAFHNMPVERRVVKIETRYEHSETLLIRVTDQGPGIATDIKDRIFDPFFTTKAEGLGMGLRLCRTIVEGHRGRIRGYNMTEPQGARFEISLPVSHPATYTGV